MSRTPKVIDLSTFKILLKYAQQQHSSKKEPIPELSQDTGKLESSLTAPFHTFDGKFLYKGLYLKAAMLFYFLNRDHSLLNGNKRMACLCLEYFCFINKIKLSIPEDYFYNTAIKVVNSKDSEKDEMIEEILALIKAGLLSKK